MRISIAIEVCVNWRHLLDKLLDTRETTGFCQSLQSEVLLHCHVRSVCDMGRSHRMHDADREFPLVMVPEARIRRDTSTSSKVHEAPSYEDINIRPVKLVDVDEFFAS
jgi:hypothetical protein